MVNLAVPAPSTMAPGNIVTGAVWNAQVRDGLNYLLNVPLAVVRQAAAQTISTGTWTSIAMDTNFVDNYNGHSTTVNPSRYVAQATGWYSAIGIGALAATGGTSFGLRLAVNGTIVQGSAVNGVTTAIFGGIGAVTVGKDVFLNVGDYVETQIYQGSGGNLNTSVATDFDSSMSITWKHQ